MLDRSSSGAGAREPARLAQAPDTLTTLLDGLRLQGVDYGRCVLRAPWAVSFAAGHDARFHFVSGGACWLRTPGCAWQPLGAGDAVLLPRGSAHVLASAPDLPPETLQKLTHHQDVAGARPSHGDAAVDSDTAASETMFCGTMRFNLSRAHPLLAMMPPVMRAGDLAARDPAVPALLSAMEREVASERIGAHGILARLADVLAASIIRAWLECACGDARGWIAALRCPSIGKVLAAVHAQPGRDWPVEQLAALMGASRSRFAQAFTSTVGETPARYVARLKMSEAHRLLAQEGLRVAVAAERLGYDSEASFSRAFKRIVGYPPSAARGDAALA
jgi:AraC-like DNA-binding protein